MKKGLLLVGLCFSLTGFSYYTKEIPLSTCNRYAKFDIKDIRRHKFGPELYDIIYYDLNFRRVDKVLLVFSDEFGKIVQQKEIEREFPSSVHFEINERVGNEQTLAKDIVAYLHANEINACK